MFDLDSGGGPAQAHSECPRRSSISFPATASHVTWARQYLKSFLTDSPLAADACYVSIHGVFEGHADVAWCLNL
jgi:hypothetical protein